MDAHPASVGTYLWYVIKRQPPAPTKKEHFLLVLPSVNIIINFATKFFEMLTKLQSEHPHKCFRCFKCSAITRNPNRSERLKLRGSCPKLTCTQKNKSNSKHLDIWSYFYSFNPGMLNSRWIMLVFTEKVSMFEALYLNLLI